MRCETGGLGTRGHSPEFVVFKRWAGIALALLNWEVNTGTRTHTVSRTPVVGGGARATQWLCFFLFVCVWRAIGHF